MTMNLFALLCTATLSWGPAESNASGDPTLDTADADAVTAQPVSAEPDAAAVAPTAAPDQSVASDTAPPPEDAGSTSDATPAPADPSWDATGSTSATADPTAGSTTTPATAVAPTPTPAPTPGPSLPDRPIRWRIDFGLGGGSTVVIDRGYRAFSDNRTLGEGTAWSVFDFRLAQSRVFLGGGLSYQRSSSDGFAYGTTLSTEVVLHEPMILGRVSVVAIDGIDAFGQVGIGPSFAQTQYYSDEGAEQDNVIPRFDAQGGVSLYLPKRWLPRKGRSRVSAGIRLGMGYTWRGKMEVRPRLYQDDDPIDATTTGFGNLNLHGMSWRASWFLRVM